MRPSASSPCRHPSSVASAQGRALRAEDFYAISTISTPAISPNGRWVAYTLTSRVEATNADPTEVWLVGADGAAAPVKVSPDGVSAARPRWERDGTLSFTSGTRRWTLDPSAPQARTEGECRARDVRHAIPLPLAEPWPFFVPCRRRRPRRRLTDFEQRHEARFKGRQFDWLNFQRDGPPIRVPERDRSRRFAAAGALARRSRRPERQLTQLGLRPQGVAWNRDGTALVFSADSAYRDERRYGAAPSTWSPPTVRCAASPPSATRAPCASFSPDGRWVLYTRQLSTDAVIARKLDHGGATDLALRPADGGAERVLTADWDLLPANATWSPDGKWVYFTAAIAGATASLPRLLDRRRGGAGHHGRAPHHRAHLRLRLHAHGLHGRAHRGAGRCTCRRHRRHAERRLTGVNEPTHARRRAEPRRTAAVPERRRHAQSKGGSSIPMATAPTRRYPARGEQPRRAALGRRLCLRLQEPVPRRQRLLRAQGQLPQLHRLRREVPLGDVGRVGQRRTDRTSWPGRLRDRELSHRPHRAWRRWATRTAAS